ncbi:MAG: hypothetical protein LBU11_12080 [Zoogloeaceae bacterium]|jgi:hypothetical protein|nr:hypothetical protein [Zoogloeaceae bacterium]
MAKKKLRKIVVNGMEYLWRFDPGYRATGLSSDPYACFDTFTAYLVGSKTSPLRVHFTTGESPVIGGQLRCGDVLAPGEPISGINLHTPKWATILIRLAQDRGWTPELPAHPLIVEDGLGWVTEAEIPAVAGAACGKRETSFPRLKTLGKRADERLANSTSLALSQVIT